MGNCQSSSVLAQENTNYVSRGGDKLGGKGDVSATTVVSTSEKDHAEQKPPELDTLLGPPKGQEEEAVHTPLTELDPYDTPSSRYRRYGDSLDGSSYNTEERLRPDETSSWCMMTNSEHSNSHSIGAYLGERRGAHSRANSECGDSMTLNSWAIMDTSVASVQSEYDDGADDEEFTKEDYENARGALRCRTESNDQDLSERDLMSTSIRGSITGTDPRTAAVTAARQELLSDVMQSLESQYREEQQRSAAGAAPAPAPAVDSASPVAAPPESNPANATAKEDKQVSANSYESGVDQAQSPVPAESPPTSTSANQESSPPAATDVGTDSSSTLNHVGTDSASTLNYPTGDDLLVDVQSLECREQQDKDEDQLTDRTMDSTDQDLSTSERRTTTKLDPQAAAESPEPTETSLNTIKSEAETRTDDDSKQLEMLLMSSDSEIGNSERQSIDYEKNDVVQQRLPLATSRRRNRHRQKSLAAASVTELLLELAKRMGSLDGLRGELAVLTDFDADEASVASAWYSVTDTRAEF